jgi:Flp pilus assembly protein TadD
MQELERSERLDQRSAKIHFALARVYRRLGRSDQAGREMKQYQELNAGESSLTVAPAVDSKSKSE